MNKRRQRTAEGFGLWSRANSGHERTSVRPNRPLRMIWGLAARDEDPTFDYISDLFSGLVEETPDLEIVPDVAHNGKSEMEVGAMSSICEMTCFGAMASR